MVKKFREHGTGLNLNAKGRRDTHSERQRSARSPVNTDAARNAVEDLVSKFVCSFPDFIQLKQRRKAVENYDVKVQEHDLKSSNLSHFTAILHAVHNLPKVRKILRPFSSNQRSDSLVVDVVALDGRIWVKVIARKAQALHLIWAGKGQYGDRDVVRQAEYYVACASEHPINFTVPEVHYAFYNEVTEPMATALEAIGVKVWGKRVPVSTEVEHLIDTGGDVSDEDFTNKEYDSNEESIEDDIQGKDDEFHIPSASEFKSFMNKDPAHQLKHFEDVKISHDKNQSKNSINDTEHIYLKNINDNPQNSKDLDYNNLTSASLKRFAHNDAITNSECKEIKDECFNKSNVCSESKQCQLKSELKQSQLKREEMFSSILGSAPVYSFPDSEKFEVDTSDDVLLDVKRVNLDITTMITLVSSITHGGCNFIFREKILSLQAKEERESPVLPELQKYLKDKELYVCQTAVNDFMAILETLGGENEKQRAKELLDRCTLVADQPSIRSQNLPQTGKIRERSKIIFGTGDQLKCVTVSANSGFVRAAEHQGITFAVYLHQSRALTEKKEKVAQPIVD